MKYYYTCPHSPILFPPDTNGMFSFQLDILFFLKKIAQSTTSTDHMWVGVVLEYGQPTSSPTTMKNDSPSPRSY